MAEHHWFDSMSTAFSKRHSRRGVARGAAALLSGVALSFSGVEARKKKGKIPGKGKGNGNGGGGGNNLPAKDPCDTSFGTRKNRNYCRFIRRQCDGDDPREFCIIEGDIRDPAKVAVCCDEGEQCCGDRCCPAGARCCGGKHCCPAGPDFQCCGGKCYDTRINDSHCGGCGQACATAEICLNSRCECTGPDCECRNCSLPGLACCPGQGCVFVEGEDGENCGGCGVTCPRGQRCIAGRCGCGAGYKYCPLAERCVREEYTCCGGLPIGYCIPPFPCCGEGLDAFCSPYLICL